MAGRSTSLTIEVLADASQAKRALDGVSDTAGGLAGKLTKTLGGLALGAGILKFGSDSIKAASDAQQAAGGIEAVFKGASAGIKQAAEGAAKSIGLSTAAYEKLATVIGSQLKTAGFTDFASKTKDLIGLGADLAAQFGGPTSDAVSAISSLMKGERDPIEAYGVTINQAAVDAEVLAEGLDTSTNAAKKHAEAQATLALLTKQTTDAQGAAAREQDSTAARYAQFTATLENVEASIGSALLPALSALLEAAMQLGPALQGIGEGAASVLGFVLDLPAPILATAAAFGALILFKDQFAGLVGAVQAFRLEALYAREEAAMNGVQLSQMGAYAQGAGSKFKGLGASLLAAVGGGPGVAIAAGIAAISFVLSMFSKDAEDAADRALKVGSAVDSLSAALKTADMADDIEAAGSAIKDAFGGNLEDADKFAKSLGLTLSDLIGVVTGAPGALDTYNAALGNTRKGLLDATAANGDYVSGTQGNAAAIQAQQEALNTGTQAMEGFATVSGIATANNALLAGAVAVAGGAAATAAPAVDELGKAFDFAAKPGSEFQTAIDGMSATADRADAALQALLLSIDRMNGGTISAEAATRAADAAIRAIGSSSRDLAQAQQDQTDAQAALTKMQDEGGHSSEELAAAQRAVADASDGVSDASDRAFEANRKAAEASLGLATAAYQTKAAQGDMAGAIDAANAVTETQRHKFIDAQIAAGMEEQAAYNLAQQLFGIPGTVGTEIKAKDSASYIIDTVNGKLNLLDGKQVTTWITTNNVEKHFDASTGQLVPNTAAKGVASAPPPIAAPRFGLTAAPTSNLSASPTDSVPGSSVPPPGFETDNGDTWTVQTRGASSYYYQRINVVVNGAIDSDSTARQINTLLRSRDRRALAVTARRGMSL